MSPFPREDYQKLEPYAPDRRPVEIDLSDNTNLRGAHPAALAAVREAGSDALARYPAVYADRLRETVARRFGVREAQVATGCGSDDLLDSAYRAASLAGGRVAYPAPTFSMVDVFARMNGLDAVPVPWAEAEADPERLLAEEPVLIYLCRPNNPTGALLDRPWVDALLEAGGPRGPLVLLDEAYAEYAGDSMLRRAPGTRRLLVLRTLSKAYGLAGLRVGFAVGSTEVVAEVEKSRGPYKVSRVAEAAAVAALEDPDGWVAEGVEEVVESRGRVVEALERRGHRPLPTAANFVLLPVENAASLTAGLRGRGVAVRPFPALDGIGDAVRVSVGPWPLMERFLQALDRAEGRSAVEEGGPARGRRGVEEP